LIQFNLDLFQKVFSVAYTLLTIVLTYKSQLLQSIISDYLCIEMNSEYTI